MRESFRKRPTPKIIKRQLKRYLDDKNDVTPTPPPGISLDDPIFGSTEVQAAIFAKGRVISRRIPCGKKNCRCYRNKSYHGPYYYLVLPVPKNYRNRGPRTKWFYLSKEEANEWRARILNFKHLQRMAWENVVDNFK
jgi:hypothetical protein